MRESLVLCFKVDRCVDVYVYHLCNNVLLESYILQTIAYYQQANTWYCFYVTKTSKAYSSQGRWPLCSIIVHWRRTFFSPRFAKIGTWCVFVSHFILCARADPAGPRPTLSPIARFASTFRNALFPKYSTRSLVLLVPKIYGHCIKT